MTRARPLPPPLNELPPSELLESYGRHLLAMRRRPTTVRSYLVSPRLFVKWAEENNLPALASLRLRDIERWTASLNRLSSHTQRHYAVTLRLWFRWLYEEGEIPEDPTETMKVPSVDEVDKDVVTPEEMKDALGRLEKAREFRDLAIVALLYDTGMRSGEVRSLLRENVDLKEGTLRLKATDTKGRFPRAIPISPSCVIHIDRYLRRRRDASPWLFVGPGGEALSSHAIYDLVRHAFNFTRRKIGPHDLRHTAATHMSAEVGANELQTLFGWRDPSMARHYTRGALVANAFAAHRRASPLERLGK